MSNLTRNVLIGSSAALGMVILAWFLVPDVMNEIATAVASVLLLVAVAALYLAPSVIAIARKHPSMGGIIVVNLFLGWVLLGWIVALVWALSNNKNGATTVVVNNQTGAMPVTAAQVAPQYQVGDVVNGHRFNGQEWLPIREIPGSITQNNG